MPATKPVRATIGGVKRLFAFRLRRAGWVVGVCLAILAGVILARQVSFGGSWVFWLLVPLLLLGFWQRGLLFFGVLIAICFCAGWWRGTIYQQKLMAYTNLSKQKVTLVGRASTDGVYGQNSQITFSMNSLRVITPQQTTLVGSIGVKGFGASAVNRGDLIKVTGKLYLTLGNNFANVSFAQLEILQTDHSLLENLRHRFVAGMQSALPEPQASFGLGLLVGQRNTLPANESKVLLMVGLTHIIAVSGYNLTIIVEVTRRWLGHLSKFQNMAICLMLMGGFLLLTGSSPSIVRASVISILSLTTWYYGRKIKPIVLLLTGAALTVLANPSYIWGNVSWYLSFLAFFGVLVLSPLLVDRFFGNKKPGILLAVAIESLCASIMTIPYILFIFGQVSLVALVANLMVVPLIPLAMLLAVIAGLAGMILPVVAGWIALPAKILLTYMLDISALLAKIPHAFLENMYLSALAMFFIYSVIVVVCWMLWRRLRKSDKIADEYSW